MDKQGIRALRRRLRKAIGRAQTSEYPVAILDLRSLQECLQLLEDRYGPGDANGGHDESIEEMLELRDGE
ncbi:MAG: hypothetical protein OEQ18_10320 [Gammaproteobacteria bacterium]|nr:hypothetical protein [Gammaproteobacteria bacterium]